MPSLMLMAMRVLPPVMVAPAHNPLLDQLLDHIIKIPNDGLILFNDLLNVLILFLYLFLQLFNLIFLLDKDVLVEV